jgi:hypothetical protein
MANGGYGLIEGSYNADYLKLTERGIKIASASNDYEKTQAIYDALFGNDIFAAFVQRFANKNVPSAEVATDYLKESQRLSAEDAKVCFDVMLENLDDYGLITELSGKRVIVPRVMALEKLTKPNSGKSDQPVPLPETEEGSIQNNEAIDSTPQKIRQQKLIPQFNFNIQIQLPENATPEVYDSIFRSIAEYLLKPSED